MVGGVNGSVVCLFRKKSETQVTQSALSNTHTKTQVAYKTPAGKAIEVVFLGGAVGSLSDKVLERRVGIEMGEGDSMQVFVASDNTVRGISKKGKHFFAFETNMAEAIRRM